MSSLTRDDEHKLKEYNRRVADEGLDSLSEDDQLWYSLLQDRYDRFLEEGMRIMKAEAAKESGGGLFGFLSNSSSGGGKGSNNSRRGLGGELEGSSNNNNGITGNVSPTMRGGDNATERAVTDLVPCDSAADEADLLGSPYSRNGSEAPITDASASKKHDIPTAPLDDASFVATFGHPSPPTPPSEFPGHHWTWLQENLIVGALPYSSHTKDTPGHLKELQEQCARRYSRISLVISCLELDEGQPPEFASPKDWDSVTGSSSFISVPLPKDPSKPIPRSLVQDVITACAQISAISHSNLRSHSNNHTHGHGSPVGARVLNAASNSFNPNANATSPNNSSNNEFGVRAGTTTIGGGGNSFGSAKEAFQNESSGNDSGGTPNALASPNRTNNSSGGGGGIGHALRRFTQANAARPEKKKIAYIHCKAGAQRCYIVAACYLMSQHGRSFEDTDRFLRLLRPSFRPSTQQTDFVKAFGEYISKPVILQPRSDDEELYQKVLADVLSLAPKERQRLLKDLEKLT